MKRYILPLAILISGIVCWIGIGVVVLISLTHQTPITPTEQPTVLAPIGLAPTDPPTAQPSQTPMLIPVTATPFPTAFVALPTSTAPTATSSPLIPPISTLNVALKTSGVPLSATLVTGTPGGCVPPDGWIAYSVTTGDTLFGFQLGSDGKLTVDAILSGNCLKSKLLSIGQVIYLPSGVAQNSPKVDDGPANGTLLPAGLTRKARCPCALTIHSGWRLEQIAAAIDAIPVGFTGRDFLAVTAAGVGVTSFSFLSSKPASASLEGFMFPTTYTLDNATTAQGFRDKALQAFDAAIPANWRSDATAHGFTLYQTIVFASIVQRESYAASEQVKIASVFYNVMAAGKALAATPTVQYAIGGPGAWWPKVNAAALKNRSRYNTYIWLGLPPTPIASPDASAIHASIYPAQTDYLYFSGNCDAPGNFYTRTYEEFSAMLQHCTGK